VRLIAITGCAPTACRFQRRIAAVVRSRPSPASALHQETSNVSASRRRRPRGVRRDRHLVPASRAGSGPAAVHRLSSQEARAAAARATRPEHRRGHDCALSGSRASTRPIALSSSRWSPAWSDAWRCRLRAPFALVVLADELSIMIVAPPRFSVSRIRAPLRTVHLRHVGVSSTRANGSCGRWRRSGAQAAARCRRPSAMRQRISRSADGGGSRCVSTTEHAQSSGDAGVPAARRYARCR